MLVRIIKDMGPGCVFHPGSIVRMEDKRARKLIERGQALPTGQLSKADILTIEAQMPEPGDHRPLVGEDLTSIVIPVYNQPEYLRRCLESLKKTESPNEIIVVDNGSDQTTKDVIVQYKCQVVTNEDNLGFPKACNQGILHSRGNRILLLNSDTVVTKGWLRRMVDVLKGEIGMVGPTTNYSCGPQCDRSITSRGEFSEFMAGKGQTIPDADIEQIADRYRLGRADNRYVDELSGFCLLIDRRVISEIGGFDLVFGKGGAEEKDFQDRAVRRGWKMVWCGKSYVHHFGHKTLKHIHANVQGDGRRNHNVYLQRVKQRKAGRLGLVVPLYKNTPVMFPTWSRFDYTRKALVNLLDKTPECEVFIIDDGSSDEMTGWLDAVDDERIAARVFNPHRRGIDNNMDLFFSTTAGAEWVAKIDNDTMVPGGWMERLIAAAQRSKLDVIAPSHFKNVMAKRKYLDPEKNDGNGTFINVHVGGLFVLRGSWLGQALDAGRTAYWEQYDKTPGGWTHFQETTPGRKAFYPTVHVRLLDQGDGKNDYPAYNNRLIKERRQAYGRLPEAQ